MTLSDFMRESYRRQTEIIFSAPWSSFDVLSSSIVFWAGIYLFFNDTLFSKYGGVYIPLAALFPETGWGIIFISCGVLGTLQSIWPIRPGFLLRLFSRMAVAFCISMLLFNSLLNSPPPLAVISYLFLAIYAVWGVFRTVPHGQ